MKILQMDRKRLILLIAVVAMVVLALTSDYFVFLGIHAAINSIAVIGIIIISGYARQLHLGQSAFLGIGAYTSAILMTKLGVSFWLTIPVAIIVAGLFGVLLGIPTLKLSGGPYLALVTQTFGEIIYILLLNWVAITGGPFGISGIRAPTVGPIDFIRLKPYFFLCWGFLLLAYLVAKRIAASKFGRFFISIRESEPAAQSVGINTMKYKITAFTVAAGFAGMAGVLYGPFIGYLSPEQFRWQPSLILMSMAIIGGLSSIEGGILGALVLTFLPELLRVTDQFRMILYGVLLIVTLAFLPDGLISLLGKSAGQLREMFAERVRFLSEKKRRRKSPKRVAKMSK